MKFGLSFLPDASGHDLTPVEYFNTALKLAKIADVAGMHTIKITEHYLHPYGGFCPDPMTFLAAVAACTKHIRLMTGCILPVFHHPVKIAAQTAMLDAISNGRLDVGFARAYLPHEFNTFQIAMDGSRDIYEQTIEAVMQLWLKENITLTSNYFHVEQATSLPRPTQQPHPPVWGAAVMARQSFSWLGEKGFNLLVTPPLSGLSQLREKIEVYLEAFTTHHPHKKPLITLSMPLLINDDESEAEKLSDQYLNHYLQVWANATDSWSTFTSSDYPGYSALSTVLRDNTPEKMRRHLQAVVGTPAQVIEQINTISHLIDVQQIIWQIDFGAQPETVSLNTLELFLEKVFPQLPIVMRDKEYVA